MKNIILIAILCIQAGNTLKAQLTTPPGGGSKIAMVGERIGITDVAIHYGRPGVKGRDGKIWGQLVPYGYNNLGFGTSSAAPWRGGANENTTIEFADSVKIEGNSLPPGKYGFFISVEPGECTLIFSKNATSWGSFFYDSTEDALRIKVKQQTLDKPVEWLQYVFEDETPNSAVIALEWEKWKISFKVEVDLIQTQLASFRRELRSSKGFSADAWAQAAQFCINNNTDLTEGLQFADYAINAPYVGETTFNTLSTKAAILKKLNRTKEADSLMQEALPLGSMNDLHTYARSLVTQNDNQQAFNVFKMNYQKHPDVFTTNAGMAIAYSATGKYKDALKYAQKALTQAPDDANKADAESMIENLKAGKQVTP